MTINASQRETAMPRSEPLLEALDSIDLLGTRWNVLEHPFYRAWFAGTLTRDDLARYATEYRWAALALAAVAELTDEPGHARDERDCMALFERFVDALGAERKPPAPATAECALAWCAGSDRVERLAVLCAIESAQPAVERAALEALVEHYGLARGPATEYFDVRTELELFHSAAVRAALIGESRKADLARIGSCAEAALRGWWALLDGVIG